MPCMCRKCKINVSYDCSEKLCHECLIKQCKEENQEREGIRNAASRK